MKQKTKLSLDDLNKSNVWTVTPSELSQMIIDAKKKRDEFAENEKHYMNIVKTVFDIQYLKREEADKVSQLEKRVAQLEKLTDSLEETISSKNEIIAMLKKMLAEQK